MPCRMTPARQLGHWCLSQSWRLEERSDVYKIQFIHLKGHETWSLPRVLSPKIPEGINIHWIRDWNICIGISSAIGIHWNISYSFWFVAVCAQIFWNVYVFPWGQAVSVVYSGWRVIALHHALMTGAPSAGLCLRLLLCCLGKSRRYMGIEMTKSWKVNGMMLLAEDLAASLVNRYHVAALQAKPNWKQGLWLFLAL